MSKHGSSTTDDMDILNRKLTKIKFSVIDKVKIKISKADREQNQLYKRKPKIMLNAEKLTELNLDINKRILAIQKEEFEKDIENVLITKKRKELCYFQNSEEHLW